MSDSTARVAELRSALEAKQAEIREGAQKGIKIDGNNIEVKDDAYKILQKDMQEAEAIKTAIKAEMGELDTKRLFADMEAPAGQSSAVAAMAAAFGGRQEAKTLGEMFTGSDEFKAFRQTGRMTMDQPFEVHAQDVTSFGTYGQKDIFTGMVDSVTNPQGFGRTQRDPMIPRQQRTARVRDLFSVAATSANLIDYFRVLGFVENSGRGNAGTVADRDGEVFGLKPKSNLRFESAQAPVRTIAHWEAAHRNVLADEPQLQATINNELLYGLALEEDDQILNGDGSNENLLGVLNTPNIQVYAQVAGDKKSDALRRAATLSVIANYPGTGFVLHPFDWEDIELQKADGDGQYMLVSNVSVGATTQVWRQPVVETPAMTEGTFLTGAFGIGAQLYDRQVANVRIAEQHADFFVRNAIAILAEERLALAVKRPESFVKGSFTADVDPTP